MKKLCYLIAVLLFSILSPVPVSGCQQQPSAPPASGPPPIPIVWTKPGNPVTLTVDVDANRATYKSSGVDVSGYFYQPQGNGPFPAVLVLHGKSGLGEGSRAYASWLAMQGYVAFAPDYFTPIDMTPEKFDATFYQHNVDRHGNIWRMVWRVSDLCPMLLQIVSEW